MRHFFRYSFIALIIAFSLPMSAMAEIGLMPDSSDKSVSLFLQQLFGGLVSAAGVDVTGTAADPFVAIIGKLNEFILIIGGILLSYTLVAGTMQTAHDGEVLGKRWSSMWLPIRTSLGVASIVPIANGYAVIQVIVMWLVLQGVGAANIVWHTFSNTVNQSQQVVVGAFNTNELNNLSRGILESMVCAEAIRANLNRTNGNGVAVGALNMQDYEPTEYKHTSRKSGIVTTTVGNDKNHQGRRVRWTDKDAKIYGKTGCGGFDYPKILSQEVNFDGVKVRTSLIEKAHIEAVNQLVLDITPTAVAIAQKSVSDRIRPTNDEIAAAYNLTQYKKKYIARLKAAAQATIENNKSVETMQKNIEDGGWLMAGAWYVQWARFSTAVRAAINNYPKPISFNESVLGSLKGPVLNTINSTYEAVLPRVEESGLGIENQNQALLSETSNLWDKLSDYIFAVPLEFFVGGEADAKRNPIMVAESFGSSLVVSGGTLIAAGIVGDLFTGGVGKLKKVVFGDGGSGSFTMLAFTVGLPLIIFGMILAYYLPFLPFILWLGGIVGWLVMVMEAVIAAPLWAVSHLYPDGDGIVGQGGQGYSLVLSLMLRPVLMVVGLALSMVAMWLFGYFLHVVFAPALKLSQGGTVGFFGALAGVALYTYLLINLSHKILALMHMVPDQILKWMGGPSSNLGEYGDSMNQGMQAAAGAFVGAAAGRISEGGQHLGASRRSNREQMESRKIGDINKAAATSERLGKINEMESTMGPGMGVAHAAGQKEQMAAIRRAADSLENEQSSAGADYRRYKAAGSEFEADKMVREKVKDLNEGKNEKAIRDTAAKDAYEGVRTALKDKINDPTLTQEQRDIASKKLDSMAPNYQTALNDWNARQQGPDGGGDGGTDSGAGGAHAAKKL